MTFCRGRIPGSGKARASPWGRRAPCRLRKGEDSFAAGGESARERVVESRSEMGVGPGHGEALSPCKSWAFTKGMDSPLVMCKCSL